MPLSQHPKVALVYIPGRLERNRSFCEPLGRAARGSGEGQSAKDDKKDSQGRGMDSWGRGIVSLRERNSQPERLLDRGRNCGPCLSTGGNWGKARELYGLRDLISIFHGEGCPQNSYTFNHTPGQAEKHVRVPLCHRLAQAESQDLVFPCSHHSEQLFD